MRKRPHLKSIFKIPTNLLNVESSRLTKRTPKMFRVDGGSGFQTPKGFVYAIVFVVRMVEGNGTTVQCAPRQSFRFG